MQVCPSGNWPISWFHFHNQQSSNVIIIICLLKFLAESGQQLAEIWLLLIWIKKVKQLISCQPLSTHGTPADFDHDQLGICFTGPGTADLPLVWEDMGETCCVLSTWWSQNQPMLAVCAVERLEEGSQDQNPSWHTVALQHTKKMYSEICLFFLHHSFSYHLPVQICLVLSPVSPPHLFFSCVCLLSSLSTSPFHTVKPVKWYCIPS